MNISTNRSRNKPFSHFLEIAKTQRLEENNQQERQEKQKFQPPENMRQEILQAVAQNKEQSALHAQIDKLIESHLYDSVFRLIKQGYRPTKEQTSVLSNIFYDDIHHGQFKTLERALDNGWQMTSEQALDILFQPDFQHQFSEQIFAYKVLEDFPEISRQILNFIQNPDFQQAYFKVWVEQIIMSEDLPFGDKHQLFTPLRLNAQYLLSHLQNIQDFTVLSKTLGDILLKQSFLEPEHKLAIEENLSFLDNVAQERFAQHFENLTHQSQLDFKTSVEHLINNKRIQEKPIALDSLPMVMQQTLEKITELYQHIEPYFSKLKLVKQQEINHLVSERIPEILYHFISLPDSFRKDYYSKDGKNLETITLQEMIGIRDNFQVLVNSIEKFKHQHVDNKPPLLKI